LILLGLGYTVNGEIQFQSTCNDTHIAYDIPVGADQANVLRLRAGICTEADFAGVYDRNTEILRLEVPFERCELKMYSDTELYVRSSQKYFSSTIEITFGVVDADMGNIEIIYHTTAVAVQCQIPTDYEVTFDYTVEDRDCNQGEKLIDGTCVWWGQMGATFEISEYTDSTYTTVATVEADNKQTTSGNIIYLGITATDIPTDFTWGVESCYIVESETADDGSEVTHLLIDPSGSIGDRSCSRDSLLLNAVYNDDAESSPAAFQLQHMLFMLTENANRSEFKLKCNIKLCCIGNDESASGKCEDTSDNAVCTASRDTCV